MTSPSDAAYRLAFDPDEMRPACVLIAAALGADTTATLEFPTDSWLLFPTPGLRVFETTREQLDLLVAKVSA